MITRAKVSLFWWRWLLLTAGGVVLFSLSLIFLSGAMQTLFHSLFFGSPNAEGRFDTETVRYITLMYAILGAVMIGWMISICFILLTSFRRGERGAWRAIALSIGVWFVLDSTFSIAIGFAANAVFNTGFLLLFALPLAVTYRTFHDKTRDD